MLGNYAQAIKHHSKYWDLSQQLGDTGLVFQAALNMGVTLWTQGLAEHHAAIAAAQASDGDLQVQKQSAERLGKARNCLTAALHRHPAVTGRLDATLHLSYVAFFKGQEAEALKYLHAHLDTCVQNAKHWCAGCGQTRGEDAPMLKCGECKVARSVLHLLIHAPSHHLPCPLVSVCARHTHAPAADITIWQVLQHQTPEDGVKEECEIGQCAAQGCVRATEDVVWCCQGFRDC